MNRKQFLLLTSAAATGCQTGSEGVSTGGHQRVVDAGPADHYAAEGIHDEFRREGFFVVRKGGSLLALSSICTHRKCKLKAEPDRSFYCPCHGSTFDPDGRVTKGPAVRDLPVFPTARDSAGHLLVTIPA